MMTLPAALLGSALNQKERGLMGCHLHVPASWRKISLYSKLFVSLWLPFFSLSPRYSWKKRRGSRGSFKKKDLALCSSYNSTLAERYRSFEKKPLFFLIMALLMMTAHARNYYVSVSGDDDAPGTKELPWRSIDKVNKSELRAGDGVYFHGGEKFDGSLLLKKSGNNEAPIIIASYGSSRATLQSHAEHTIYGYNVGGFRIVNLLLLNSGKQGSGIIFFTDDPTGRKYPGVSISRVEIANQPEKGISFGSWTSTNPGWDFLSVSNVHLHDNGTGMETYGYTAFGVTTHALGSITVFSSEFDHNESSGLVVCGAAGGMIVKSSFHHNQSVGGCWTWGTSNIIIDCCISHDNFKGDANDGFGFDLDGGSEHCVIQRCLSYHNETPGFVIFDYPQSAWTANNVIRYCISENDVRSDSSWGSFEIFPWGDTPIENCHIHNCVAYLTSRAGESSVSGFEAYGQQTQSGYYSGKTSGCSFRNNVIYLDQAGSDMLFLTCHLGAVESAQIAIQNNIYYSSAQEGAISFLDHLYTHVEDWKLAFPHQESLDGTRLERVVDPSFCSVGHGCEITDPQEIDNMISYCPTFSSPCRGNGLDLSTLFGFQEASADFLSKDIPRDGPFPIGAIQ